MEYKTIIQSCEVQEQRYQFSSFSRADALRLGQLLCDISTRYEQGVAIAIEINGLRVFQYVTEGAGKHNVEWLQRKFNTVNQFGRSSLHTWAIFEGNRVSMADERLDPQQFAMCGGGFPLLVRGMGAVGTIGVSGLPHLDDHQLIVDALDAFFAEKKNV